MAELSAADTDRATSTALHDAGSAWMTHTDTMARGVENGYENGFAFYFAGRGGVLGETDAEVIYSAFGWFAPHIVAAMWNSGVAVHGAKDAVVRYYDACADWGRDHLGGVEGLDRFANLGDRVLEAAETSGRPLFAGWKVQPRVTDDPGRAIQVVHVFREWRGANHLIATTAAGLSPLESILSRDGERSAKFMGWNEPFPELPADAGERRRQAEELTDRLCAPAFEVLDASERADFVELVGAISAAAE
jgi:hypothetical protein